jgi:hypothetical protein
MYNIMDLKMKYEINNLVKHGIPEDVAIISVCLKYNKKELAEDLINERKEEQELLREELEKFVEFKIEETRGEIMSGDIIEDLGKK